MRDAIAVIPPGGGNPPRPTETRRGFGSTNCRNRRGRNSYDSHTRTTILLRYGGQQAAFGLACGLCRLHQQLRG
jgi:hypothetical protein